VIVDRHGENFFGAVLIDDVLIKVLFDDMRLILGQNIIELTGKNLFFVLLLGGSVFIEKMIDFADTVAANCKPRAGVIDGHIVLIADFNGAFAETALVFY